MDELDYTDFELEVEYEAELEKSKHAVKISNPL